MTHWRDATSYRQGDKKRIPNVWSMCAAGLSVTVVKDHIAQKGVWSMHCHPLGFNTFDLGIPSDQPAEEAQTAALKLVQERAQVIVDALAEMGVRK